MHCIEFINCSFIMSSLSTQKERKETEVYVLPIGIFFWVILGRLYNCWLNCINLIWSRFAFASCQKCEHGNQKLFVCFPLPFSLFAALSVGFLYSNNCQYFLTKIKPNRAAIKVTLLSWQICVTNVGITYSWFYAPKAFIHQGRTAYL